MWGDNLYMTNVDEKHIEFVLNVAVNQIYFTGSRVLTQANL